MLDNAVKILYEALLNINNIYVNLGSAQQNYIRVFHVAPNIDVPR